MPSPTMFLDKTLRHVDGLRVLELVSQLSLLHRVQGSDELEAAADLLATALGEAGVEVRVERLRGPLGLWEHWGFWEPRGWRLYSATIEVEEGGSWKTVASTAETPLVAVVHSPGGDATGEAGYGKGKILVVDDLSWERYYRLVEEQQPEAVVAFHRGPGVRYWGLYPPFFEPPPTVPAASLPAEKALGLVGRKARVRVEAEYHTAPATPIVVAEAGEPGAPTVILAAHLCHPRPGAHDNASGVAVLAAAMEALAGVKGLRVVAVFAPEWTGTAAATVHAGVEPGEALAALSVDMVGADLAATGGSRRLISSPPPLVNPLDAPLYAALRSLDTWLHLPYERGSDHDVLLAAGAPASMLNEWPDHYYHTSLDTPNNLSPTALRATAAAIAAAAKLLAASPRRAAEASLLLARSLLEREAALTMTSAAAEATGKLTSHARAYIEARLRGDPGHPWSTDLEPAVNPPVTRLYLYKRRRETWKKLTTLNDTERRRVTTLAYLAAYTRSTEIASVYTEATTGEKPTEKQLALALEILDAETT